MPAALSNDLVSRLIQANKRVDSRALSDYRPISVWATREAVKVRGGDTMVLARVSAELVTPVRPNMGMVSVYIPHTFTAKLLETCLNDCVDLESLCFILGEKVWNISVHLSILSNGGNLLDIAHIGVMIALRMFRRPHVSLSEDSVIVVHPMSQHCGHPIPLVHFPFVTTFVFHEDVVLLDPTTAEEDLCSGRLFIATNKLGEVSLCHIDGKVSPNSLQSQLRHLVDQSISLSSFLTSRLDSFMSDMAPFSLMGQPHLFWDGRPDIPVPPPEESPQVQETPSHPSEETKPVMRANLNC